MAHNPGDALEDDASARQLLQCWTDHWEQQAVGYWAVSRRDDPAVLGLCGVKDMTLHVQPLSNLFAAWTLARGAAASPAKQQPPSLSGP